MRTLAGLECAHSPRPTPYLSKQEIRVLSDVDLTVLDSFDWRRTALHDPFALLLGSGVQCLPSIVT